MTRLPFPTRTDPDRAVIGDPDPFFTTTFAFTTAPGSWFGKGSNETDTGQ